MYFHHHCRRVLFNGRECCVIFVCVCFYTVYKGWPPRWFCVTDDPARQVRFLDHSGQQKQPSNPTLTYYHILKLTRCLSWRKRTQTQKNWQQKNTKTGKHEEQNQEHRKHIKRTNTRTKTEEPTKSEGTTQASIPTKQTRGCGSGVGGNKTGTQVSRRA